MNQPKKECGKEIKSALLERPLKFAFIFSNFFFFFESTNCHESSQFQMDAF